MSKKTQHKAGPVPTSELAPTPPSAIEQMIEGARRRNPRLRAREERFAARQKLMRELGK